MSDTTRNASITWDWKEQPDLDQLAEAIAHVTGGTVRLHRVETYGDEYGIVLTSNVEMTSDQAQQTFDRDYDNDTIRYA